MTIAIVGFAGGVLSIYDWLKSNNPFLDVHTNDKWSVDYVCNDRVSKLDVIITDAFNTPREIFLSALATFSESDRFNHDITNYGTFELKGSFIKEANTFTLQPLGPYAFLNVAKPTYSTIGLQGRFDNKMKNANGRVLQDKDHIGCTTFKLTNF